MSFLAEIFRAATVGTSDLLNPSKWMMDALGGRKSNSGQVVNEQTTMGLSAYFAGIRAISEDCAKLPLKIYRQDGKVKEEITEGPVYSVLRRSPNPAQTPFQFRELLTSWAAGWGSGFARIVSGSRYEPVMLVPIHPRYVTVKGDASIGISYEIRSNDKAPEVLEADEMFHVMGLGKSVGEAFSVARLGIESMGLSLAAQTFGASFFGNGTALSGVLTHPGVLRPATKENLQNSLKSGFGGAENVGRIKLLEEGVKFEKVGIPPEEAQFIQTREFGIEEVARWLRMPPHKLQHLLRSTYANIEHQSIEYVVDTLMPWLVRWEEEVQRKLLGIQNTDLFAKHTVQGLLRGDHVARAQFYQQMFMTGVLSLNEIRELEELNPIGPEGDRHYVPLNLQDVEEPVSAADNATPPAGPNDPANPPDRQNPSAPPGAPGRPPARPVTSPTRSATAAFNLLVSDAVKRFATRQEKALSRIASKNSAEPDLVKTWAAEFFGEEEAVLLDFLAPIMNAFDRLTGMEPSPGRKKLIGAWHVQNATKELVRLATEKKLAATLPQWHEIHGRPLSALTLEVLCNGSQFE